jgi:hypothetical protein
MGDVVALRLVDVDVNGGWVLAVLFIGPILIYNIARIIDPVRVRRWEVSRWWRFRPGTRIPDHMDPDLLAKSRELRIRDRLNAIVIVVFLALLLLSMKS